MYIVLSAVFAPGIDLRTFFYIYEHIFTSNLNLSSLNLSMNNNNVSSAEKNLNLSDATEPAVVQI